MRKIKNKWLRALTIFGIAVVAWSVPFTIDAARTANNQTPLCCFKFTDDGLILKTYLGLFYTVYVYDYVDACIPEDYTCDYEPHRIVEMHSWFYHGN